MLPLRMPFKDCFADIQGGHTPKYRVVFQLFLSMFSTKMENFATSFCSSFFFGEMCFLISLHSSFCAQVCETPILLGSSARTSRETPPANQSYQLTYFTNYLVDSLHS